MKLGGALQTVKLPWDGFMEWKRHRTLRFILSQVCTRAPLWFPGILSLPGFLWLLVGLRRLL